MVDVFKRLWLAVIGFLHFKTNPFLETNVAGVDVVIYDGRGSLDDALIFALGKELPLLSMNPPTLYEGIESLENIDSQEISGKLSYRKVTIDEFGDWWSEWREPSATIYSCEGIEKGPVIAYYFFFGFSMEEGPLTWESVSPLLNVNQEKDVIVKLDATLLHTKQKEDPMQNWCKVLYRWFDAQYSNCTMTIGDVTGAQCGFPSEKYHGDAPHPSQTSKPFENYHFRSLPKAHSEGGETEEDQL